ncbi:hypothetical protein CYMTET_37146 [Cymbomonas tetramitiformis]|uniref:Uncharacterized protein n=1 Tax=Cymbomonas tetramitiformis TaxID=36881 RepID=A0AAE0CFV1_9CHLO|nr:hypothetical protein CYMTET_37146 [Cymbomonas tetramitiformis]
MTGKRKRQDDGPNVKTGRKATAALCEIFDINRSDVMVWNGGIPICKMNKEQLKAFLEPIDSTILTEQKETVYVMLADTLDVPADNCKKLVEYVPPAPSQDHRKGGGGGNYKLNKDVLKSNMMNPAFQQKFEAYKSCFNVLLATPRAAVPDPLTHTPSTIVDDDVADKWMNQVGEHQGADQSNLATTTADHSASLPQLTYYDGEIYSTEQILNYCACLANQNSEVTKINEQLTNSYNQLKMENHQMQSRLYEAEALRVERTTTADRGAPRQEPSYVHPRLSMELDVEHQDANQSNLATTTADHDHSNLAMNTADHGASLPQLTYYDGEIYSTQQILNYCAYLANQNSKVTKINEQLTISYNQLETEIHQMQSRLYEVEALRVERERRINILEARLQGTSLGEFPFRSNDFDIDDFDIDDFDIDDFDIDDFDIDDFDIDFSPSQLL